MEQLSFFDPVDKSIPGATWWTGNYQCRNWNGCYQSREGGSGPWQFHVYAFGEDDAVIYTINDQGVLNQRRVPMDAGDCLQIDGKSYGRSRWNH